MPTAPVYLQTASGNSLSQPDLITDLGSPCLLNERQGAAS
jgi:hypothetical protein